MVGSYKWARQIDGCGAYAFAEVELCEAGEEVLQREPDLEEGWRKPAPIWIESAELGAKAMLAFFNREDLKLARVAKFRGTACDTDTATAWLASALATAAALGALDRVGPLSRDEHRRWIIELDDGRKLISPLPEI